MLTADLYKITLALISIRKTFYLVVLFAFVQASCVTDHENTEPFTELELHTDQEYPIQIPDGFDIELFADNLARPTSIGFPPDGSNR